MERADLDAGAVVDELRTQLRARPWAPSPPPEAALGPMLEDPNLAYLHRHWALRRTLEPTGQRRPVTGLRSVAKAVLARLAFAALRPYLDQEQELLAHAVRLLDGLARRCDAMMADQARELDALRADLADLADLAGAGRAGAGEPSGTGEPDPLAPGSHRDG